ncbi:MAG: branched-chain amino acid ABC transporter permease [Bdellovibrio sp.]|nr:MAG: branched-chain amino acid ABC transporter permease [Bdellovibrio sp.]
MQDFAQHFINGLSLGSIYALIALGYTMVYGILQLINFAHSDVYMMGAFCSYYAARFLNLNDSQGLPSFVVLLMSSIIGCAILGFLIERLAYRPLRNAPKLNVLIAAIGVSLLLQYTGQSVFGDDPKVFPTVLPNVPVLEGSSFTVHSLDLVVLGVTLLTLLVLNLLIFRTRIGMAMRAVSQNMRVASLMGVNPNRIISATFILGSALAGVGSVLVGLKYPKVEPLMGTMIGMKAFIAAVLGGIGNLSGAVLGAVLMGLSEEMVVGYLSSTYRDALAFGILIAVLIFKPAGLLGRSATEKV